jgi:hypothetical protein
MRLHQTGLVTEFCGGLIYREGKKHTTDERANNKYQRLAVRLRHGCE